MLGGAALNRGATAARYLRERIKSSRHGRRSLRSATSRAAATAPPATAVSAIASIASGTMPAPRCQAVSGSRALA